MPPTFEQYYGAIVAIAMYLSRYSTGTVGLTNAKIGDYIVNMTFDVDGTPIVDENPIDFDQFTNAILIMAQYCEAQKMPESSSTPVILVNGVLAEYTTEWTAAGIYDQVTHSMTLLRTVGEQISTINLEGTTRIRVE